MDIGRTPKFDLDTWQLTITGIVNEPLKLSFDELKKIGIKKFTTDFHCVRLQWKIVIFDLIFISFLGNHVVKIGYELGRRGNARFN
jgi:DMSO/TMAO reductase YedYZ molybdopterin-dependent catalytic subunit